MDEWVGLIGVFLGAVAAIFGGYLGNRHEHRLRASAKLFDEVRRVRSPGDFTPNDYQLVDAVPNPSTLQNLAVHCGHKAMRYTAELHPISDEWKTKVGPIDETKAFNEIRGDYEYEDTSSLVPYFKQYQSVLRKLERHLGRRINGGIWKRYEPD